MTKWTIDFAGCLWFGTIFRGLAAAIVYQKPFFAVLFAVLFTKEVKLKVSWRK